MRARIAPVVSRSRAARFRPAGGGGRNDEERGDQQYTDDFHRNGDHHGQQQHEQQPRPFRIEPLGLRKVFRHCGGDQGSPQIDQRQQDKNAAAPDNVEIAFANGKDVAEQEADQIDAHPGHKGEDHQTDR